MLWLTVRQQKERWESVSQGGEMPVNCKVSFNGQAGSNCDRRAGWASVFRLWFRRLMFRVLQRNLR